MDILNTIHWDALLKIVGVDLMLGVDNAIVIALACSALPPELRARAMILGTAAAVLLRAVLLWAASYIVAIPFLKIVAGAYLVYLGYKFLTQEDDRHDALLAPDKMTAAIKTIVVADFMMSLDNVLAVTSAAHSTGAHSTAYAIGGIVLSIPIIVFGAKYLTAWMSNMSTVMGVGAGILGWLGAGLLGWIGAEMILSDAHVASYLAAAQQIFGELTHLVHKVGGFLAVIIAAILYKLAHINLTPSLRA